MASPALALAQSPPLKPPAVSVTRRIRHCWSELPLDLMRMVFERLGFLDFDRAKSVCSSWQYGSRQCKPSNKIPWMVLFPMDKNYCLLINSEDKEKIYRTQHLGDNFAKSICLTTYRSWLLMQHRYKEKEVLTRTYPKHNVYILDLLTRERINLPAFKSANDGLSNPILWIDEKTKDYLVIGMVDVDTLISFKKGNNSWKEIPQLPKSCTEDFFNMVYKDHKLYCLNCSFLYIFDFLGEVPLKVFRTSVRGYITTKGGYISRPCNPCALNYCKCNIVVTLRGDVLIVKSFGPLVSKTWTFKIYKMDPSTEDNWEEINSLGDESILLELGITVLAKDQDGVTRNSIYFTENKYFGGYEKNGIFIFNLDTKKVEQQPQAFVSSSMPLSHAHWFLPNFKRE
ncbi:PREDICTED: F-box protein At1g69090-like [Camelina sativa]|uniref:F-box protein At1g69090-like n=1 Tax=Camelina sativa TaxID=90675 RepID=A0ABM0ZBQ0_CAMSA|nr:PREDICTED: F-box protein At1g69090-like [Camelina sativa]